MLYKTCGLRSMGLEGILGEPVSALIWLTRPRESRCWLRVAQPFSSCHAVSAARGYCVTLSLVWSGAALAYPGAFCLGWLLHWPASLFWFCNIFVNRGPHLYPVPWTLETSTWCAKKWVSLKLDFLVRIESFPSRVKERNSCNWNPAMSHGFMLSYLTFIFTLPLCIT